MPTITRKNSLRLKTFDYASQGSYFITICSEKRKQFFSQIGSGTLNLTLIGNVIDEQWRRIPERFENTYIDEYVIMPNHIHGIITIHKTNPSIHDHNIGNIIQAFKNSVTRRIRNLGNEELIWQRGFYDRIIRDQIEFNAIKAYIVNNPNNWIEDVYNKK